MHPIEFLWRQPGNIPEFFSLSPVGYTDRPDVFPFGDARSYYRLFSGLFMRRSPAQVMRKGLFLSFVRRSSLLKLENDIMHGFNLSLVPYPLGLNLRAWGIVTDWAARTFEIQTQGNALNLVYQGGSLRSPREWRFVVASTFPDESAAIRQFYRQAQEIAANRIIVAGTLWIGLWDALWMSFDIERAIHFLETESEFVSEVFSYWYRVHAAAVSAMLDAQVRLIFIREHSGGFPPDARMAERLDPFVGERFRELSKIVRSRGGYMILESDVDELIETDYPYYWGFDGVGPLMFRDEEDLLAARACLAEELVLIGTVAYPGNLKKLAGTSQRTRGLLITNPPPRRQEPTIKHVESLSPSETHIAGGVRTGKLSVQGCT